MKKYTITAYKEKIEKSLNTKYTDDFLDRFTANLERVSLNIDGTYLLTDLEKAWNDAGSYSVYNDRGLISI